MTNHCSPDIEVALKHLAELFEKAPWMANPVNKNNSVGGCHPVTYGDLASLRVGVAKSTRDDEGRLWAKSILDEFPDEGKDDAIVAAQTIAHDPEGTMPVYLQGYEAGLAAQSMPWQPIETAPRDGTMCDLWMNGNGRLTDHWWDDEDKSWCGLDEGIFTHWMQVPEAPTPLSSTHHGDKA
jgi:hypothetical protein